MRLSNIVRSTSGYGQNTIVARLTPGEQALTDAQLVVLADHGNGCFGGRVERQHGLRTERTYAQIVVYTD